METPEVNDKVQENTALIKAVPTVPQKSGPMVLQLGKSDEQASGAFSFSILWQAFLQRFKLAFPLGLVLAAISCLVLWYVTEPKYRSAALLKIHEKPPFVAFPTEHTIGSSQTQIELLRGSFIIGRAIETEGLMQLPELQEIAGKEDAVLWIQKRLKAERIGPALSELYEVSFTTRVPETAQKVAAAVVNSYLKFQLEEAESQRETMLDLLKEEQRLRDGEIVAKRDNLRELARQAGGEDSLVVDVNKGGKGVSAKAIGRVALLSNLQQKLVDTEVEIEISKAQIGALREELNKNVRVPEGQIETAVSGDPAIVKLKHDRQIEEDIIKVIAEKHPRRVAGQAKIDKIDADLDAKTKELQPKILKELQDQVAAQRRDSLSKAESDLANHEKMAVLFRDKIVAERADQAEHSDKSLEVEFARNELDRAEEVRRRVADRAIALTIEGRAPGAVISIQDAKLPAFPDGPTLAKKLAITGSAAFLAPFMLLVGWDLLHRRVLEREQLAREFDLKIVSEVAALPARALLPRPGANRAYQLQAHLFEESVNSLRTTLAVDENLKGCRVFVVASAVSGEGKTNLSSQLAMSWSHAVEGRIIIVDADLRAPNIHDLFEVKSGPGLAEVLRGECTLDDAVVMDWGDRLFVLPAGAAGTSSPSHLFSGPRFRETIDQLRSTYDRIIIDVPPILCASETLLIAKEADGVLMCALHDYSRSGQVKQAYDRLTGAGVKVVGAVLNGAPARKYAYSYRGYVPG